MDCIDCTLHQHFVPQRPSSPTKVRKFSLTKFESEEGSCVLWTLEYWQNSDVSV